MGFISRPSSAATALTMRAAAGALLLGLTAAGADAQALRGRLTDADGGWGIEGAHVVVRTETGRVAAQATTDADGRFFLPVRSAGEYLLEAVHTGYARMQPEPVRIEAEELVLVDLVLSRTVVTLEPLTVTGRRRDVRHDASWLGALARRDQFPARGSQRVLMRGDPEFNSSARVAEILRWMPAQLRRSGCQIVYWDGNLVHTQFDANWWLSTATSHVEAVEYYRTYNDAPQGLRGVPLYIQNSAGGSLSGCSVVALWPRTGTGEDDPARRGFGWGRIGAALGVAVLMFFVAPSF